MRLSNLNFRTNRPGNANPLLLLAIASIVLVAILMWFALRLRPEGSHASEEDDVVTIYCAAGIAKPVQKVIDRYNQEFNTRFKIERTGGSGALAGQIATEFQAGVKNGAELYITADPLLLAKGKSEGMVSETFDVALQSPVVAIRKDSEIEIKSFRQMVKGGSFRFGVASSRAAVGKMVRKIAKRDGFLTELENGKITEFENVMTLAQALVTKSIDVALIWDTTVTQINRNSNPDDALKICCPADPLKEFKSQIAIGVISTTANPTTCLKLARYLTAPEKAQSVFEEFGFTFLPGDAWAANPEIHLFCGSMFTPVIEESVRDFAKREGINLYPKWEGCGKLVTRMKFTDGETGFPDAYFACDQMFLDKVADHFRKPTVFSKNQIVVAISNKSKSTIKSLQDLLNKNVRVGICDPEQSALGTLTKHLLKDYPTAGFYEKLSAHSAVTTDVGPTLVSQLLSGGLDAAIVYRSNIMSDESTTNEVSLLQIESSNPFSVATQPWAVSRSTRYPQLMQRMFNWIQREQVRKRFSQYGFQLVDPIE